MFRLISFLIFLVISITSKSQILDNTSNLFSEEPFFNSKVILAQKIKSINGELYFKRDYEKMQKKGVFVHYNFDERGRLISFLSVFNTYGGIKDTAIVYYEYDEKDRLVTLRKGDAFGFYSFNYCYNDSNHVVKETYSRDVSSLPWQGKFELVKQYPIAEEVMDYQYFSPAQYKIRLLNSLGVPYKEVIVYLDDERNVIEKSGRLLMTNKIEKFKIKYNKGLVVEKEELSDFVSEKKVQTLYKYDNNGLLLEVLKFKNEKQIEHSEFVYDGISSLFNASISHELENKIMNIVKYKYEFY